MRFVIALLLFMAACSAAEVNNSTNTISSKENSSPANTQPATGVSKVTFDSPDGVKLVGSFYAAEKPNSPALLLLHQWQSDRHSYDDFAKRMNTKGFAVLSIDGRGFGESKKKADGAAITAGRSDADVNAMLGDVDASVGFLAKQQNVDGLRIGIVGASYGSSLAIIYASDHKFIGAVALLSPGLNYFGNMPTRPAVEEYGDFDLFIVAAKGDEESMKAVEGLKIGKAQHGFMVLPTGNYHGTDMFKYRDKTDGPSVVEDALESFFMTRLALREVNPIRLGEGDRK